MISVGETVYFDDVFENKRHPANFRGWDGNNAVIIWKGSQMQMPKERIHVNDIACRSEIMKKRRN